MMDLGTRVNFVEAENQEDTYICFLIVFSIPGRSDFWCNVRGGSYVLGEATKNFLRCCASIVGPIVSRSCQTEVADTYVSII